MEPESKTKVKNTAEYKNLTAGEALKSLESSASGLTQSAAETRLRQWDFNEISSRKKNPVLEFLRLYWGPMPWLLELAIVLSLILRHYLEALIIFILLSINATISYLHSRNSQRAVDLLKSKLAVKAKVLRDNSWKTILARELVPGDVISLRLGDLIPADIKILNGFISVDQSALTGESIEVNLKEGEVAYSGSMVKQGEAKALAINTGPHTYFGRTIELVKAAKPGSHQQEIMMTIVKYMMLSSLLALLLVLAFSLSFHFEQNLINILTLAVIFLMGAVPVALPAVLTIVQAVGATELARKGAVVTRLDSLEDAASIDVLCLDKTGTITRSRLAVTECQPMSGQSEEEVISVAALASSQEGQDPIDLAIIDYAADQEQKKNDQRAGDEPLEIRSGKQISYLPFEPATKRTEAFIEFKNQTFRVVKGAPQVIEELCPSLTAEVKEEFSRIVADFSRRGYRTVALAWSEVSKQNDLKPLGFLALSDPPRPDSRAMIEEIKKLGLKPVMLTGDNLAIAKEIGRQVGLGEKIINRDEFVRLGREEQIRLINRIDGLAEIYPEDKYQVVKLWQATGHLVGMTGDGVNDAPALKQAEMGIAVYSATDVAKAAASLVLTEPGIGVIEEAIKISRQTYQRMLSWVINKIIKVLEFTGLLTISFLWLHEIVLSLLGMSLLVLANDFVTMSLSTDRVKYTGNPNRWNLKNITLASSVVALFLLLEDLFVIWAGLRYFHLSWGELTTLVMLNLIFNSQFRVLMVRERNHFWSSMPGQGLLLSSLLTIVILSAMAYFGLAGSPLPAKLIISLLGVCAVFVALVDFPKYYVFKKLNLSTF
jgi:H+-transporting ATPase